MKTTAREFLAACNAGLKLWGQKDGVPEWVGTERDWRKYQTLCIARRDKEVFDKIVEVLSDDDHDCHANGEDGHCNHESHVEL